MANKVFQYGMTVLNSDILVCGGGFTSTSNCTLYASAGDKWTPFTQLPVALSRFAMITMNNNRPYVLGGQNGDSGAAVYTVYTYDTLNAWTQKAHMQWPLFDHTAVALDTNTAMVCGGRTIVKPSSTQSLCSTYTICICGVYIFVWIILVGRY